MNKLLATTAVAMLLGVGPALAAEDAEPTAAEEAGQTGQLPTTSNVTEETAKEAKIPDEGEPDESGGAMERSSAPPESGAVQDSGSAAADDKSYDKSGDKSAADKMESDSDDTSME